MIKRIFIYLLLLLAAQPVWATSIVILITPHYILIGADSKRLLLNAGAQVAAEQSVCKIRSAGKYCYTFAGFTTATGTSFSADSIVTSHLSKQTTYDKAIEAIKKDLKSALYKELAYEQLHQPQAFAQLRFSKSPLLEVAILSLHNGAPKAQTIGFECSNDQQWQINTYQSTHGDAAAPQQGIYFMGSYNGMEQYLGKQNEIKNPEYLVEQLIKEQAKATPASVGAPVQMAKYSAAGIEWLR